LSKVFLKTLTISQFFFPLVKRGEVYTTLMWLTGT